MSRGVSRTGGGPKRLPPGNRRRPPRRPHAAPAADDLLDRLERLAELKKQGILTDAEFEAQKAKLLAD